MNQEPEIDRGLSILKSSLRVGVIVWLLAVSSSSLWFSGPFAFGVFLGGAFALLNLALLFWLATRWIRGSRTGMIPLLLAKFWFSILLFIVLLSYLPVSAFGLLTGMGLSIFSLVISASLGGKAMLHHAERSTNA